MYKPFWLKHETDGSKLTRDKSCMQIGQLSASCAALAVLCRFPDDCGTH